MADVRELLVGPGIGYPFLTGARIFSALAFPTSGEESARQDAETAYIADRLHAQSAVDETDLPFEDPVLNEVASRDPSWVRRQLRTTRRRMDDRQEAARAVRPWVRELVGIGVHGPVPGIRKFTQRQIALYLCNGDVEKAARFEKRVWRPSRPVLHVAIAIDEALSRIPSASERFGLSLDALEAFRLTISRAATLQQAIAGDRRFATHAASQLTLRWLS